MTLPPPSSTRTATLFPYTTPFRSNRPSPRPVGLIHRPAPDEHPYPVIRPRPVCRLAALAAPRAGGAAGRAARRAGCATAVDAAGAHRTDRRLCGDDADTGGGAFAADGRSVLPHRQSRRPVGQRRCAGRTPPRLATRRHGPVGPP